MDNLLLDPLAHFRRPIPEYLTTLLSIEKKSELEKYAKKIQILSEDFCTLILNAEAIGYCHQRKSHEFRPQGLEIMPGEVQRAFSTTYGKKIPPEARKVISKFNQIFEQRRLLTSHFFFNSTKWHLFYFDQRDYNHDANHWKFGSHIHFVNHLWPNFDPKDLWEEFDKANATVGGKLHISYFDKKRAVK
jgi:hypothetical protein